MGVRLLRRERFWPSIGRGLRFSPDLTLREPVRYPTSSRVPGALHRVRDTLDSASVRAAFAKPCAARTVVFGYFGDAPQNGV